MKTPICLRLMIGLTVATLATRCHAAHILAIFSDTARSHVIAYEPLTQALAARGHHVTVISSHPQKKPLANYTDIVVQHRWFGSDVKLTTKLNDDNATTDDATDAGPGFPRCRHFLNDPQVNALIHSTTAHYDVILLELYIHECFLGFAHKFDAHVIGIYVHSGGHLVYELVGNTNPYSYVPDMFRVYTDRMTFWERLTNIHSILANKLMKMDEMERYDVIAREFFNESGRRLPKTIELQKRFAFIFFNNDVSLNLPRPMLPNVMDIAGMHIKPAQPLPQDLRSFLDSAKDGVILFSMGSHVGEFLQSKEKLTAFLEAFSRLKQVVLWKRGGHLENLPRNVRLMEWLPQADVLAHPNVLVYLTHGGLLGIQEAVYHSKPIVGIPIYGDQFFNVHKARRAGFGIHLDYDNITSQSLEWALTEVIEQTSYTENARLASARFRDHPISPLEKAVFWTEYVIRHNGAKHLRSAALDLKWYQYLLLDVIGALALGALLVAVVVIKMAVVIVRSLCGERLAGQQVGSRDGWKNKQQ